VGKQVSLRLRRWFWLEDQPETVFDYRTALEKRLTIEHFESPVALTKRLVEVKNERGDQLESVGFLLDVMVTGQQFIMNPPSWHGGSRTFYYHTDSGHDAGLVFFEKLLLRHPEMSRPPISPPPPVIFLSVMHRDQPRLEERWERLKRNWAREHNCRADEAKIEWVRKWDPDPETIIAKVRAWERSL